MMRKTKKDWLETPPTPAEQAFYDKLKVEWKKTGHVKITEMLHMFGWTVPASVYDKIRRLELKGYLVQGRNNKTMRFLK